MLTPGSLRAEAIRACFMEAGLTSSLFRTVLEAKEVTVNTIQTTSQGAVGGWAAESTAEPSHSYVGRGSR